MSALLRIEGLKCAYQSQTVLASVSFDIEPGEIACLLGKQETLSRINRAMEKLSV